MKIHALAIGVNNYPGQGLDLAGCVNDADDWAEAYAPYAASVKTITDRRATKRAILQAAGDLLGKLNRGDWGLISFSGHGTWVPDEDGDEPDGRDECLCPYDCEKNLILDDEVRELVDDRPPGSRVFLAADSCHSGTACRMAPGRGGRLRLRFLPPWSLLDSGQQKQAQRIAGRIRAARVKLSPGVVYLAACRDSEYASDAVFGDDDRPNGALTRVALDTLRDLREPTFANWIRAIRRRLPSYDYPQTPGLSARRREREWTIPFRAK